ncbi:TPA: hypothetical protein NG682_001003 [Vibrio parahaemolyticus]|uniref:hypothetical protein n=1 Tax=Vibrio parahaemolyticus TaxID=670 RepID=UPI001110A101|nr:hypothetical protein [Vibrio parahaemolyticus]TMX35050.1 hypothetical protein DA098_21455 [Vibrio parahaemolyticus]TMX78268.1 hypothetical protein DA094_11135 [Vibrio parahaemolyticus]HCE3702315.1 hypothetical protein [Vibrio parahaemolyticus]
MFETMLTIFYTVTLIINVLIELGFIPTLIFLCFVMVGSVVLFALITIIGKLLYEITGVVLKGLFGEIEQSDNKEAHTYDLDNDQLIINLESYNKKERLIVISEVCNVLRKENNNESTIENE